MFWIHLPWFSLLTRRQLTPDPASVAVANERGSLVAPRVIAFSIVARDSVGQGLIVDMWQCERLSGVRRHLPSGDEVEDELLPVADDADPKAVSHLPMNLRLARQGTERSGHLM